MPNEIEVHQQTAQRSAIIERVLLVGDLAKLTAPERVSYYSAICESVGLNPLTRPFDYLTLSGKMVLYANKGCTDQLRQIHEISVQIVGRERVDGLYLVTARATNAQGRQDEDVGAVPLPSAATENASNAIMKAHTKAKRRVTLSICGLSLLDESEIESVANAARVAVNHDTGEVVGALPPPAAEQKPSDGPTRIDFERMIAGSLNQAELDTIAKVLTGLKAKKALPERDFKELRASWGERRDYLAGKRGDAAEPADAEYEPVGGP